MQAKANPLNLNALQLRTLAILQELAKDPHYAKPGEAGAYSILGLPHAHGNHFHVGHYLVSARDASGLNNQAVWTALERKGLASATAQALIVTAEGMAYDTGVRDEVLSSGGHH